MNNPKTLADIHFDTRILSYLISITDEGSLTQAAEKHYLSQPAMSRYLRDLEEKIGTKLFTRTHNSLKLTESGMVFINGARSILHAEQEMEESLSQLARTNISNEINIALPSFCISYLEKHVLPQWNEQYPDIHIIWHTDDGDEIRKNLQTGVLDLGILFSDGTEDLPFMWKSIKDSEIVCCLPHTQSPVPQEISAEHCLKQYAASGSMLVSGDSVLSSIQERLLHKYCTPLLKILSSSQLNILIDLAKLGYGPILFPKDAIQNEVESCRIKSFTPQIHLSIKLAWNKKAKCIHQIQHFIENHLLSL